VHLPLRFLGTHLGTRFGALGLLRCRRLSLHLPLRILRRGGNLSAGTVHRACWRMLLAVTGNARSLTATCDAGPEPASLEFELRPVVSHGPASAVPALKTTTEQPARSNRLMFICVSLLVSS